MRTDAFCDAVVPRFELGHDHLFPGSFDFAGIFKKHADVFAVFACLVCMSGSGLQFFHKGQ